MVHPCRQMFIGGTVCTHVDKCLGGLVQPCRQMFRGGGLVNPCRQMFRGGGVVHYVDKCLEEVVWCTK